MVRPRWQVTPPNRPAIAQDWAAFGLHTSEAPTNAVEMHDSSGEGSDIVARQETLDILCSFYGPNAAKYATLVRDGLAVAQNREGLRAAGLGLVGVGAIRAVPDLVNQQWYRRLDMMITFNRGVVRHYPVLNILSAEVSTEVGGSGEVLTATVNVQQGA
jgi:hypothetical protein